MAYATKDCTDLARQWRNVYPRRFALEHVPEGFKVRVSPPHYRVAQLKGGDIRLELVLVLLYGALGLIFGFLAHLPYKRSHNPYTSFSRHLRSDRFRGSSTKPTMCHCIPDFDLQEGFRYRIHLVELVLAHARLQCLSV